MRVLPILGLAAALAACSARETRDEWGVAGLSHPRRLLVAGGSLFFADELPDHPAEVGVFRVSLGGGLARAIALGEKSVDGLVVVKDRVCWSSWEAKQIKCAPAQGGALPQVLVDGAVASELGTDGSEIYYALRDGALMAISPATKTSRVVSKKSGSVLGVIAGKVFLRAGTRLAVVGAAGGELEMIDGVQSPGRVATDGKHVYVLGHPEGPHQNEGGLYRLSLGGRDAKLLAKLWRPWCLAVDAAHVWACAQASASTEPGQERVGVYDTKAGSFSLEKVDPYFSEGLFHEGKLYFAGNGEEGAGGMIRRKLP